MSSMWSKNRRPSPRKYTSRETVVDLGPVHATADRQKTLPLPPVLGIAAVAGGVVLLIAGVRRHA
jgi:hypothetical protein